MSSQPAPPGSDSDPADRRRRLSAARLYVVTGARQERGDLEDFLAAILEAGADLVQLREKEAEAGDLLRWGEIFMQACAGRGLFILNDRPDVALALGADGVHLGQNDLPLQAARRILGPDMLIGLSTHSGEQLAAAGPEADYVCAGPVHETPTKPGRPATGLELVREAALTEKRPWFAIGGIDRATLPAVARSGARRIVVARAVTQAWDPAAAVRELLRALPE